MAEYSFDGILFGPKVDGLLPQPNAPESVVTERHIPYSDATVIEFGGKGPRRYTINIRLLPENVTAFEDRLQQEGVLVLNGESWGTATLMSLTNHTMSPREEYHFYDATWIIG